MSTPDCVCVVSGGLFSPCDAFRGNSNVEKAIRRPFGNRQGFLGTARKRKGENYKFFLIIIKT